MLYKVLFIPVIFVITTAWLYILVHYLAPNLQDNHSSSLKFPTNVDDLRILCSTLEKYKHAHISYVLLLFSSAYLWKQTFAIPGSVFLNMLSGALFGVPLGFIMACVLSATGATCCYLLSYYLGKDYLSDKFPHKIAAIQSKLDLNSKRLFLYLLSVRIFPMSPNWFLNAASPIIGVPVGQFYMSVFIGLMPYIYVCVSTGHMLSEIHSTEDIFSTAHLIQLTAIAIIIAAPNLITTLIKRRRTSVNVHEKS